MPLYYLPLWPTVPRMFATNPGLFGLIGMWETVAILAVVLVLFGAKKVPELARGLGDGIREFKKASREATGELQRSLDDKAGESTSHTKSKGR
jgi:sec-independent protein translocase protein TatA